MEVDLISKLKLTADFSSFKSICSELASDIVTRKLTFVELVEQLETPLTSPELEKHLEGLKVLQTVVELLPKDLLSATDLDVSAQFFCSQLKQHHIFTSVAINGLYALVQQAHLSNQSLHVITSTLFNSVVWQTQPVHDRTVFYTILQYIIFNRLEDYRSVSSEFLVNVISSVDGERDPRNLLLLFSFLLRLYMSISLGPLAEDAFEVVSCYFPIDFYSSASEPGAITREDLVSALTPCLLAVPDFATFCLPLILEKLESRLKSAKIDSYNILIEGCKVWPSDYIMPHREPLWLAIKQDALPPIDAQTAEYATQALQALVKAMPEPSLTSLLNSVIHSCEGFLSNVQLSLFEPSSRLLLAAMQASTPACDIVSYKLLSRLVSLLQVAQGTSQVVVIKKLTDFIQVCLHTNSDFDSGRDGWSRLLTELRVCVELGPVDVKQAAYTALTLVVKHLDSDCRHRLYLSILSHVTADLPSALRIACIRFLQAMALIYGDEVQTHIAEKLTANRGEDEELWLKKNKFETICSLAVVERFHSMLEEHFIDLLTQGHTCTSMAISCLRNLLQEENVQRHKSLLRFLFSQSSVLPALINQDTDGDDLLNAAKVIKMIVRLQSSSEQAMVVQPFVKDLLQNSNHTRQIVFLECLVGTLWTDVTILTPEEISSVIIPLALNNIGSSLSRTSALQLLSSLINKSSDDTLLELVSHHLQSCSPSQAITAHAYITKALVLRGHGQTEHWLNKLVDLLDCEENAETAADGFQLIVDESQTFLNHQNHCHVKLLYRQRLFHLVVPRLVQNAKNVQHYKALAYLLQAVPHTVYEHYIKQIMPLLVKSLDTDCEVLLLSVLHILTNLLSTSDALVEDHVDTFIPRFLYLARQSPLMKVRIAALQCLFHSLKFSTVLLLPYKPQVLTELVHCLDDKKRLVRREAARTRSKWFLLAAPSTTS